MKCRALLLTLFAALIVLAFFATRTQADPNQVRYIAPGVWFREGDPDGAGYCNNVIIEMKDYLIVVDANFPGGAAQVLADCQRISTKPVKYVFDTHHHGDHAYGNAFWSKNGATTMAFSGVADEMQRYEPARWKEAAKKRADVAATGLAAPEPPHDLLSKSPYIMKDGTREVRFYHFGWAHTRGDGFVYLPKERILCTGDAVVNGPYNFTGDGDLANWPKVIHAAQQLPADFVLPGHGVAGGKELLEGQARFLLDLYKAVENEVSGGHKLEELVAADGKSTSIKLPDRVKNWVGPSFPAQVRDAYEEIVGKKPHGDLPH
ncbi:MAG: MBL fold metallo-hydrolase [Acidobacteriota bacterium]|nr:MBL fold metallo-hydrolase [Acidobacteriota bacterium]